MRKLSIALALVATLAIAAPAAAAAPLKYKGKTSSGHNITFTVKKHRIYDLTAGIRASCIPIQGGGSPMGGVELFAYKGYVPFKKHNRFSFMGKPAFYYNEVTLNHDLWTQKRPNRVIKGRMRLQYEFLIPKYPIGTFSIYSCAGGATFKSKPVG